MKIGLMLLLFSCSVFADDYSVYTLLNGSVQAVFSSPPHKMDVSHFPNHTQLNISMYSATDQRIPVAYHLRARNFSQDKEIGAYNNKIKKLEDDLFKQGFLNFGGEITNFHSVFDKKRSLYTAEITGSVYLDGFTGFRSESIVVYKKRVFQWSVLYKDKSLKKELFDKYKTSFKVMR